MKLGEPNQRVEPTAEMRDTHCESWLSPFGTRSSLVSRRDGWRDIKVQNRKDYSSVKLETTTSTVDQYKHRDNMHTNSITASVERATDKQNKNGIHKISTTLGDSCGEEPDALHDTTTAMIACV